MSKSIGKFPLEVTDVQQIEMPNGAEILTIQTQDEIPCIWALVDINAPKKKIAFEIFGTGHNVPENAERRYVGTFQMRKGALVFHCFLLIGLS